MNLLLLGQNLYSIINYFLNIHLQCFWFLHSIAFQPNLGFLLTSAKWGKYKIVFKHIFPLQRYLSWFKIEQQIFKLLPFNVSLIFSLISIFRPKEKEEWEKRVRDKYECVMCACGYVCLKERERNRRWWFVWTCSDVRPT